MTGVFVELREIVAEAGMQIVIITGRVSESVAQRARELRVDACVQDPHARKLPALRSGLAEGANGVGQMRDGVARIRDGGPVTSDDVDAGDAIDWYWGPTRRGRALLEALAESGVIGIRRRDGNRRGSPVIVICETGGSQSQTQQD